MAVLPFKPKPPDEPHNSGKALCLTCAHAWVAVTPIGTTWLECPSCHTFKGRFIGPCERPDDPLWHCACGNEIFYVTRRGCYCPNCGAWQSGF